MQAAPAERVAAMELYGTLLLWKAIYDCEAGTTRAPVRIRMRTDNQGNTTSVLNAKSRTWPSSIIMMQLIWEGHKTGDGIQLVHTNRKYNTWADALAAGDTRGFNPELRKKVSVRAEHWDLLKVYTEQDSLTGVRRMLRKKRQRKLRPKKVGLR